MKKATLLFNKAIIVSLIIYLVISFLFLHKWGINTQGEALKYIDEANALLHHQPLRNGVFSIPYLLYPLILSFFIKFSVSFFLVGVIQIVASATAAIFVYKAIYSTLNNTKAAFISFVAYLLCYPVQKWNFFLYTESLHTSFLVICICSFTIFISEKNRKFFFCGLITLITVLFTRPVGIVCMAVLLLVAIVWLYNNKKYLAGHILVVAAIIGLVALLNSPAVNYINPDSIRRMEIICQVPEITYSSTYQEFNREGLGKAFYVIKNEIGVGNFLLNGCKKLGAFFGLYRPYYSWKNNLFLMLFYVFYPFALVGIFKKQPQGFYYLKLFSILYIAVTAILIFFTCDEWSNRFIAPVFPFVLILAVAGYSSLLKHKSDQNFNG